MLAFNKPNPNYNEYNWDTITFNLFTKKSIPIHDLNIPQKINNNIVFIRVEVVLSRVECTRAYPIITCADCLRTWLFLNLKFLGVCSLFLWHFLRFILVAFCPLWKSHTNRTTLRPGFYLLLPIAAIIW